LRERIDLVVTEPRKVGGLSLSVAVSLALHSLLVLWLVRYYQPVTAVVAETPMTRYVELIRQNPQPFVEAPGPKADSAPLTAPRSDANRRAMMPEPTGPNPTARPGDGSGQLYTPPMGQQPNRPATAASPPLQASGRDSQQRPTMPPSLTEGASRNPDGATDGLTYREPSTAVQASAAASGAVDWRSAIREAGKVASLGGDGIDLGQIGGDRGFAEQGPLSFETQWFDWGDYAQSMVSRIRVNWYAQMPQLIRSGIQGVVTIRFTIERDGRISEVTILNSSGVPPYDFAAKKAIELSSPLNPLPRNFPKPSERVTAMFYYNMQIPGRS
jgi:TonB family protein